MDLFRWDKYHNYGMLILALLYFLMPSIYFFILFSLLSFSIWGIISWNEIGPLKPPGGIPNYISLFRYLGLIVLSILSYYIPNLTIGVILIVLTMLDGLDGFFARKLHQQTKAGGLFDMEIDSVFVCITGCLLFEREIFGMWILIPGFLKYAYVVFTDITGLNPVPEQRTKFGAVIAAILFFSLSLSFILGEQLRNIIAITGTSLVIISFSYSLFRSITFRIKS